MIYYFLRKNLFFCFINGCQSKVIFWQNTKLLLHWVLIGFLWIYFHRNRLYPLCCYFFLVLGCIVFLCCMLVHLGLVFLLFLLLLLLFLVLCGIVLWIFQMVLLRTVFSWIHLYILFSILWYIALCILFPFSVMVLCVCLPVKQLSLWTQHLQAE